MKRHVFDALDRKWAWPELGENRYFDTLTYGSVTLRIVQLAHAAGECIFRRKGVATHSSQITLGRSCSSFYKKRLVT